VPRLTVRVQPSDVAATVTLDGVALAAASLGTALPVDPGSHHLEASADATVQGRASAMADVTVRERDVTSIELKLGEPASSPAPAPVASPAPEPATPPPSAPAGAPLPTEPSHARTGAIVTTAGAVVLAAGGAVAFVLAGNAVTSGQQSCAAQQGPCDAQKNTVRAWDFTAAGAWVGAAALGTVAVLLWTQPQTSDAEPARARLLVGPASAAVWGQF
jgi:hypothetical protein